jgi:predicted ABC-type ATPase
VPILSIIAGPNGAGKSSLSADLYENTGIKPFDFDYKFLLKWSRFSFDPSLEQVIHLSTQEEYEDRKNECLVSGLDFAFETNYHDPDVANTIRLFRKEGYRVELIFLFLATPEEAIARVNTRVLAGGHAVSIQTIRERFYVGLDLLDQTFDTLFNEVSFFLSRESEIVPIGYFNFENGSYKVEKPLPESVSVHLFRINQFLKDNS